MDDLSDDVLCSIASLLGRPKDRMAFSRVSHKLRTASQHAPWWPRRLRVMVPTPQAAASFADWVAANALGNVTHLRLRVKSEQLCDKNGKELPRSITYDGDATFENMMRALVVGMPALDTLFIKVPMGTLFLRVG